LSIRVSQQSDNEAKNATGRSSHGELFPIDDAANINLLVGNADAMEPFVAVTPAVPL
jgi:hypothetical protein